MKNLLLTVLLILNFTYLVAQSVDDYVKEGIEYHDKGQYSEAIKLYKKALKLEPNSDMINYELSLSCFSNGDYQNAIKYADVVLKQKSDYKTDAYVTKGSALDMQGKTKESIKVFERALKKEGNNYLLRYNLAINYVKLNQVDIAEKNLFEGIKDNPNHSSSHLMIASIEDYKGHKVQAALASHYFLFLEPNSNRSEAGYKILMHNFGGNVTVDKDQPNTININIGVDNSEFSSAELMISMLAATKTLEENADKSEDEMFIENTKSFFSIMGELKEDKSKGIWWDLYTPFFYAISQSDYMETYCKYITQGVNPNSKDWVTQNENMLTEFSVWLKSH